jgi:hypothetical protein
MSYPTTYTEATRQGYKLTNTALCRLCGAEIEWWITPQGKRAPIDSCIDPEAFRSHFASCPFAPAFRKKD